MRKMLLRARFAQAVRVARTASRASAALLAFAVLAAVAGLYGCTVYQTAPNVYSPAPPPPPSNFDRSWNAALGAFADQGFGVTSADRASGSIHGRRGSIELIANLQRQADGSVRVQFNTVGAAKEDPGVVDRVSRAFDARMGY